ncbi:PSD1 and planctomycete cytochrome C domain-containing protein [soil metagenome]
MAWCGGQVLGADPERVDFERHILPVFAAHCSECHGSETQKSALRLDSAESVVRGGDSGEPLFQAGRSAESQLFVRVSRHDPDEAMPPEGKGDPLSVEQVDLIRDWIDQGAQMPEVAEVALTTDHWSFQPVERPEPPAGPDASSPVDAFVGAKLKERGLSPSPQADAATLVRRLYLVMHGLPPTPQQVEEFASDPAPDAWGRLVDRVLDSPQFGERWGRHWLDVVRFAESNGFETNRERPNAYHFRDYVIESFNADKPYDRFVKEQIAGDAMGADVATGFLVAGSYDIVKSPDINLTLMQRQDELADMVNTTGTAFLGLTLGCARCHNHKFDPIPQKDYYAMQAVFAGVTYGDRPVAREINPNHERALAAAQESLSATEQELDSHREQASKAATGAPPLRPPVNATLNVEEFPATTAQFVRFTIRRTNQSEPCLDELVILTPSGQNVALAAGGARARSSGDYPNNAQHRLEHINDGRFGNGRSWISNQDGRGWVEIEFPRAEKVSRIEWARDREGQFTDRVAVEYVIELSSDARSWTEVASSADRAPFDSQFDPAAFVTNLPPAEAARARALLAEAEDARALVTALQDGATAWVANFSPPPETHRLYRGDPMAPRERVAPDALTVTGTLSMGMDEPEQARRVKLAEWVASPENPLTSRVIVNRLWHYTFGTGLVDTPSDFGGNGTTPTHPELLDWLAAEFVEHGWSVKHMLRLLCNSDTFQQSSRPRDDGLAIDADCRLLWRFPPRRIEAEAIRDSVLAATGALDKRMGGPGFYLLDVDRENVVHYFPKDDIGPAEWRRMIYMFKIRQEQDAVFGAFDCPDGSQSMPKRSSSTTPLQALNLFNSPFVIQQAEMLAERLAEEAGDAPGRQVARAFRLLYGRDPDPAESADSVGFIAAEGLEAWCRAMLNTNEFLFVF